MPYSDEKVEFTVECYKAMRTELVAQGEKYDKLKLWLTAGIGAYYAWFFSNIIGNNNGSVCSRFGGDIAFIALIIPLILIAMSAISSGFLASYFTKMAIYFFKVENQLGIDGLKWQKIYTGADEPQEKMCWRGLQALSDTFWWVIFVSTALLSYFTFINIQKLPVCVSQPAVISSH